ncbi:hypothetical protein F2Q69_00052793 [Brassica cretica]|uniref:Uncharacterized protein n=1 Tax=Brassica cretica TaxID=69181 RepID=A0A8S9MTG5_BRACR|nr:hypothetical protein F2Q69_00052793 [Brassica cretica]
MRPCLTLLFPTRERTPAAIHENLEHRIDGVNHWRSRRKSWSTETRVDSLERLTRRRRLGSRKKLEVETESFNQVTAPTLHHRRHEGDREESGERDSCSGGMTHRER